MRSLSLILVFVVAEPKFARFRKQRFLSYLDDKFHLTVNRYHIYAVYLFFIRTAMIVFFLILSVEILLSFLVLLTIL